MAATLGVVMAGRSPTSRFLAPPKPNSGATAILIDEFNPGRFERLL